LLIKIVKNKKVVPALEYLDQAIPSRENLQKAEHKNKGGLTKASKGVKALPMTQTNSLMITKKCKLTIRDHSSMVFDQ
jgi:hypothetical protein